ncbi:MAG: cytochrome-c peroxidase, partial [Betaproteobacteria bacterium]|nr:cytochrome-c peroxidase [Betaproteobacteria bacterium]
KGLDPRRVALGKRLFHDPRLSADATISCASCHNLAAGGVDGLRFSIGIGGAVGNINAPTVFNSAYNLAQFWDGRAATLEEQAAGPIQNPIEMGATWPEVLNRLSQDDELVASFHSIYPDGLTAANLLNAIATFERSLITVNSRFDRYLRGDEEALSALEMEGYSRFREYGCVSCHQGMLVGGNMYQKFGVLGNYFAGRPASASDLGRYSVTHREEDRYVFKVPSLRNVALTAPYFHDGSAATLEAAVLVMGRYQLGLDLPENDVTAIVAFLTSLTGELPQDDK